MAGLPQANPMPGTVQLDPLTGQPMAPPAPPPPFAAGLAGPPAQWPPQSWLLGEDDQQPGPSPDAQQAMLASPPAPSTNDPAQMVPPPAAPAPVPPEGPPAPAPEALPQDYQAHDVSVVENPAALAAQHREMAPPAPAAHMTPEQAWMQHLDQSAQNQAEATKTITDAALAKNQAEAEQGVRLAQDMQRRQASADSMYMQTYQDAKNKRAQLDQEAQDIANQKIDPDRAWHSMSFGAQVLSGISAALVGLTTRRAMTGQNHVVDMLNGMAQRDMEAQKMDLETRIGVLGQRRGLLADDLAAGRDMLDFQYKSNAAAYEMGRNAIKSYVLQFDNPAIAAQGDLQLNAINDADWMNKQAYLDKRQAIDLERQKARAEMSSSYGHLKVAQDHEKFLQDQAKLKAEAPLGEKASMINARRETEKDRRERMIIGGTTADGQQLYAKDKDAATKANEKAIEVTKSSNILDELSDIYTKNGWNPLGKWAGGSEGKDAQRAKFLSGVLYTNFSKEEGQGTIRDNEYKMYKEMFGDPTGIVDPRGLFGQVRQTFVDDVNDSFAGQALDENGQVAQNTYWQPKAHFDKKFSEGGAAKKNPAPTGLPGSENKPAMGGGNAQAMTPGEEDFVKSGKFTPAKSQDPNALLDYAGR